MLSTIGFRFHHFGLATRKPETAVAFLKDLGYVIGETIFDPNQNANLILCTSQNAPAVEIISPGVGENPLDKILNKFQSGVYHLCYEVDDLEKSLEQLNRLGLRAMCVVPPKSAVLFGGDSVSFYQIINFGLIEIIQR